MTRTSGVPLLLPGQSSYVVECAIAEGRLTYQDVVRYLNQLPREIREIEQRLRKLRTAAARGVAVSADRNVKRMADEENSQQRKLGGAFGGYIRRVPVAERSRYQRARIKRGLARAVAMLRKRVKH